MRTFMRFSAVLVLLNMTACISAQRYFSSSVDVKAGAAAIKGVRDEVTIRRDGLGVPYIEAKNEEDLFFATGYAMASDRLWQMVLAKMVMRGRLSEITGPGDLKLDIFIRTMDFDRRVRQAMAELDRKSLMIMESFARGVNAYISAHPDLPPEFRLAGHAPEAWTPEDSLYVFAMFNLAISFNLLEELNFLIAAQRVGYDKAAWLIPVYPDEDLPFEEARKLADIPRGELLASLEGWRDLHARMKEIAPANMPASNNWALSGSRTKSGKPIVANDTHLPISVPGAWYLMHLKCPGYEAAGVTIPGIPVVSLGYNGSVAWGATMVMADSQDLFIEKIRTVGGRMEYLYRGQWLPVEERVSTVKIKGEKPVTLSLRNTRHGPLINDALGTMPYPQEMPMMPMPVKSAYGLALSWAIEGMGKSLRGIYDMARAGNVHEARGAISRIECIYLNYVYGDRNSIAWQVSGRVPVRKKGLGLAPSPGWTGEYDWNGFVPFNRLPHAIDPPEGYLVTANNRTVNRNFRPFLTAGWYHPDRAERVRQVLSIAKGATVEDMRRLQLDRRSLMAEKIQRLLARGDMAAGIQRAVGSWSDKAKKERAKEALAFLDAGSFDAEMTAGSTPAAVMGAFHYSLVRELFLDELGPEGTIAWDGLLDLCVVSYSAHEDHLLYRDDSPFWDNTATPGKEVKAAILAEALQKAIMLCEERMGKDRKKWRWGRLHAYHWKHEFTKKTSLLHGYLNRGPFEAGGDVHTVNVAAYPWGRDFGVFLIPAMRMIVDFGIDEPAFMVGVPGQSGNPSSPHYGDMLPYFLEGTNRPMPFGREAVERQYRDVFILRPVQ